MLKRLRKITKADIIKDVYYDVSDGYGSIQTTYKRAKELNNNIKLDEVKTFPKQQPNHQIKNYRNYNS